MDKPAPINIFEVKTIRKDFSFKLAAADTFNEFLYVGDEKGTFTLIQAVSIPTLSGLTIQISSRNPPTSR